MSVLLEAAGWRVINLGIDVPIEELQKAVRTWKPDAVGASFVLSKNINKRFAELGTITEVPVFVGGRSIRNHMRLARRWGLVPIVGSAANATSQWLSAFRNRPSTN